MPCGATTTTVSREPLMFTFGAFVRSWDWRLTNTFRLLLALVIVSAGPPCRLPPLISDFAVFHDRRSATRRYGLNPLFPKGLSIGCEMPTDAIASHQQKSSRGL